MSSDYLTDANKAKLKLDKVSDSMCLAKWMQTSLHLTNGMTNSCYHPPLHKIDTEQIKTNPSKLHNTDEKKLQRDLMIKGKRPDGCSYCWKLEDDKQMSDRHYRSGEPWAMGHYQNILDNPQADIVPTYVEVDFSNACNFKCSYCSPQFSTAWAKETEEHGAWPTSTPHNAPAHFKGDRKVMPQNDNPYVEAFWKWWPELYPQLRHFRMTGGEPMMDKNTFRVFEYVIENPKKDLHLNVTSNFCPPTPALGDRYFNMVKTMCDGAMIEHFMQFVSLDAWGERAEYIRNGMDFSTVWSNVHRYLHDIKGYNSITFIITMNNLSVSSLKDLLENILRLRAKYSTTYQRVWFDTPILRFPIWQHIGLLDESFNHYFEEAIEFMEEHRHDSDMAGIRDFEIAKLTRTYRIMQQGLDNKEQHLADFWRFFRTHDSRRETDLLGVFPEYKEWFKLCQQATKI